MPQRNREGQKNKILGILDDNGVWVDNEEDIERVAVDYFENLFSSANTIDPSIVLRDISPSVSSTMNEFLVKEITEEEVKRALFSLNPTKAPGQDGMTALFFQRFWEIIKGDLINMVKNFFSSGIFDEKLNETNICLISKVERPREMSGFRPISLCNVSYKIISKILSLRLKKFLSELISETQSAFVAGRLITDNILIAQENFYALRSNPTNRKKFMALKTDMSKAYDRVEWSFLRALMEKMGFDHKWVNWIMQCITSVSYRILINGDPKGRIRPSRGIRQGDPISPYLFILCTEALIAQIRKAEREGKVQGLRISYASPRVSHLLFADDSLFFCQANAEQSKEVIDIIRSYAGASGQEINLSKSSIMFGNEVPSHVRHDIKSILGISREGGMGTYLGLPEKIHGSKAQVFAFVRDRLQTRVNTWSSKFLSKGGKEVLIKSQAKALPTYVMSCFLLPKAIYYKLNSAIANFWWSNKVESRGIHWIAWDQICSQLSDGGLGFRTLEEFNLALLAKQLWRLLRFVDSLFSRVLKGRYFRYCSPLEITVSNRPSYGWRSMLAAKDVLKLGIRKTIGSGFGTYIWTDPWIPDSPARPPKGLAVERDPLVCVNSLIDFRTKQWKMDRLRDLFLSEEITLILGIKPSLNVSSDGYCWTMTKSGNYTVKSGYEVARTLSRPICDHPSQGPSVTALKAQAWKLKTTRKIKHFVWQCVSGCLASCQRLFYRHIGRDKGCPRCGAEEETINHLIFECPPARQVWPYLTSHHPLLCFLHLHFTII